jgi:lysine-ketoglutarate reductase/saccharopine dehydrogenase-like protein (TIGR00300 family)
MFSEEIILEGHIIDSWILPKVFDAVMDLGGEFEMQEFRVGRRKDEASFARMKISADSEARLHKILTALQDYGAELVSRDDVQTAPAPCDGALPDDFYSTTNLPTQVRLNGHWVDVSGTEMDLVIVVDREQNRARMIPMADVRRGDPIAIGHEGIRVIPFQRARDRELFSFMASEVSSEKPKRLVIEEIAKQMRETRAHGGKILVVAGPAIVHSGAAPYLAQIIRAGSSPSSLWRQRDCRARRGSRVAGNVAGRRVAQWRSHRRGTPPSYDRHQRDSPGGLVARRGGARDSAPRDYVRMHSQQRRDGACRFHSR